METLGVLCAFIRWIRCTASLHGVSAIRRVGEQISAVGYDFDALVRGVYAAMGPCVK
jgi:hypothetical protein